MSSSSQSWTTHSAEETMQVGRELASMLKALSHLPRAPQMLILRGDLGAGKTTLVKGIAAGLGAAAESDVTGPTFTLVHEYQRASESASQRAGKLYHLDLYRLEKERELDALGIDEMQLGGALVLIEWGEKFPSLVACSDGEIAIEYAGGDARTITLKQCSGAGSTWNT